MMCSKRQYSGFIISRSYESAPISAADFSDDGVVLFINSISITRGQRAPETGDTEALARLRQRSQTGRRPRISGP